VNLPEHLEKFPVLPILNHASPDEALVVAEALLTGGVKIMEITLRTDLATDALIQVRREFPKLFLGVGSITSEEQLDWAVNEGINFGVSPAWSDSLWERSLEIKLPFIPGILTPTELLKASYAGCYHLKIFPIEPVGGISYLNSLIAPFRGSKIKYLPTGGISKDVVSQYLRVPEVMTVGGSWLTPKKLVLKKDRSAITKLAKSSLLLANTT